jgi:hypothetical protein
MTKATKIDAMTFAYRGFLITRNYISKHGSGRLCESQQGFAVTPSVSCGSSSGINGKWEPSVSSAVAHIDELYARYDELPARVRAVVDEAALADCEAGQPGWLSPVACPDQHLCRYGIDN